MRIKSPYIEMSYGLFPYGFLILLELIAPQDSPKYMICYIQIQIQIQIQISI